MRVISGKFRGLKLNSPKDNRVRPTTDRVKESMFNVISEYIYGARVLDLFAGSGALGIESISRGSEMVYFIDNSKDSISVLKSNLEKIKSKESFEVYMMDYKKALEMLSRKEEKFDVIFLDPPYYEGLFDDILTRIDRLGILKKDGIVVVEHDSKDRLKDISSLKIFKEKKYGITMLTIYHMED